MSHHEKSVHSQTCLEPGRAPPDPHVHVLESLEGGGGVGAGPGDVKGFPMLPPSECKFV